MKRLILLIIIAVFCSCNTFKKEGRFSTLRMLMYSSTYLAKDSVSILETDTANLQICYYKDYTAYVETIYLSTNDKTKPFDPNNLEFFPNGIQYNYLVMKAGTDTALVYENMDSKIFSILNKDSLLRRLGIDSTNLLSLNLDLGKPKKVIRNKKTNLVEIEYFYDNEIREGHADTISRFYDSGLIDIEFSFSKSLDKEKKSKLVQTKFITLPRAIKQKDGSFLNTPYIEDSSVMREVKPKDEKLFLALFKRFEKDIKKVK